MQGSNGNRPETVTPPASKVEQFSVELKIVLLFFYAFLSYGQMNEIFSKTPNLYTDLVHTLSRGGVYATVVAAILTWNVLGAFLIAFRLSRWIWYIAYVVVFATPTILLSISWAVLYMPGPVFSHH